MAKRRWLSGLGNAMGVINYGELINDAINSLDRGASLYKSGRLFNAYSQIAHATGQLDLIRKDSQAMKLPAVSNAVTRLEKEALKIEDQIFKAVSSKPWLKGLGGLMGVSGKASRKKLRKLALVGLILNS